MKKTRITAALICAAVLISFATGCQPQNTVSVPSSDSSITETAPESSDKPAEDSSESSSDTDSSETEQATTTATTTEKPATTTQKPATTTQKPATTTQKPATTTQKPATTTQKPATTKKPATTAPLPEIPELTNYSISNPKADAKTKKIYSYLCENFGKQMFSCQQESTWMGSPDYEMNYIKRTTGKLPAMRGLDFMNNDFDGVVSRAIEWDKKGGLVTICWHTGVQSSGYQESLDDKPDYSKLLKEGTTEYKQLMNSWDKAAKALQKLQDAGVTVLWRPFHEFDGGWFWWGKGGGSNFIKLWRLMYDKFTNEYKLNNLIWVLGYSGEVKNGWYPGDEYCDVIGSDTYDSTTNKTAWARLLKVTNADKPLAFHECGNIPQVLRFQKDGAVWSWFMIWHTDYITQNNVKNLKNVYNDDKVITLDELPKF